MHQAEIIVLLFTAVGVLAVLAHKITLPYPIVLVLGGLALSFVPRLPAVNLNPDVVFYFILPALIYPAALFTSWRDFRRNLRPILLLAIGLVLATMLASCVDRAFHCAGASMGGCFCPRRNCLPARCGCGDGDYSPARRSSSHTGDTRGRESGE